MLAFAQSALKEICLMASLQFTRHERISLRASPDFNEMWLHDRIAEEPTILGLGELAMVQRERIQTHGGRLDLLLTDADSQTRFEVEVMLGATDPSHIIRCIEYWDEERRRFPAYDHIAVLVAEEVTSRFLHVMSLMAGSIPLIAIQLNALKVGEHIVLDFVKVLDQRMLREDDTSGDDGAPVDRAFWTEKAEPEQMKIADELLTVVNEIEPGAFELHFARSRITVRRKRAFFNLVVLWPKKRFMAIRVIVEDAQEWVPEFQGLALPAKASAQNRLDLRFNLQELTALRPKFSKLFEKAIRDGES
jgi:hypothetical protein